MYLLELNCIIVFLVGVVGLLIAAGRGVRSIRRCAGRTFKHICVIFLLLGRRPKPAIVIGPTAPVTNLLNLKPFVIPLMYIPIKLYTSILVSVLDLG